MTLGPTDTPPDAPSSLGTELRAAREAAGLTVEQVSADTRIRVALVRDLESDNFVSSGGAVYARGHLRALAHAIGADPAPLVARFDAEHGQVAPEVRVEATPIVAAPSSFVRAYAAPVVGPARNGPRWGVAVAAVVAVFIAILVVGQLSAPKGNKTPVAQPGPTATSTPTPVATTPPPVVPRPPVVTGAKLRVRIVGGSSWVSISNASSTLFRGVLHDGQFRDFSDAKGLKVVVGNAGAVNLSCGGRENGPAGKGGSVRHFNCSPTGLTRSA